MSNTSASSSFRCSSRGVSDEKSFPYSECTRTPVRGSRASATSSRYCTSPRTPCSGPKSAASAPASSRRSARWRSSLVTLVGLRMAPIRRPRTSFKSSSIPSSVGIAREKSEGERSGENLQVEEKRPVLDVIEIVLDPLVDAGVAAQAVDLRPAGHSRLDHVAQLVTGEAAAEALDEHRPLGPRAHQAHVAFEDVEQLGELVEREPAQPGADGRDARIARLGEARPFLLGVDAHGA